MFSADDFAVSFADWPKNGPDPDFAVLRRQAGGNLFKHQFLVQCG